jgi:uncharacterized membrane protein required for colicin V production
VEVDVILVILLVAAFLLGVLRGAVRQLIIIGAWVVVFVVSVYLRPLVGDFIAGNLPGYTREYVDMLAFASTFVVLFALVVVIIELRGATVHLTRRVAVDEILGGLLALGWTLLAIATIAIALDSYYAVDHPPGEEELEIIRAIRSAFERSGIIRAMHESLIPGLVAIFGPLLPPDIRAIYAR